MQKTAALIVFGAAALILTAAVALGSEFGEGAVRTLLALV